MQLYRSRISGPLLDRIDLQVDVPAVPYKDLRKSRGDIDSATMRSRIAAARAVQEARYEELPLLTNADLEGASLERFCALRDTEHDFLKRAVEKLRLSARAYTRILRIARTIADLGGDADIDAGHLAEAINYRTMDRQAGMD